MIDNTLKGRVTEWFNVPGLSLGVLTREPGVRISPRPYKHIISRIVSTMATSKPSLVVNNEYFNRISQCSTKLDINIFVPCGKG